MKKLLALAVLFVLFSGFTLAWDPVTKYTDNTAIEATKTVLYNVDRGGVIVSVKQPGTTFAFTSGKGATEAFKVQTELSTGEKSVWSPVFGWTSPLGVPGNPQNLRVAP